MSEDARNSLIALACVSLIFGAGYLLMWLIPDDVVLPSLIGFVALPVIVFTQMLRWMLKRRKRREEASA
jgi:hypothetical protein